MSKTNVEPLAIFSDGSQLIVSTHYSGDGRFSCELFVSVPSGEDDYDLRAVSEHILEARTCREAQHSAYQYAMRRYPGLAGAMKAPPYLIWAGHKPRIAPGSRGRRLG